MHPEPRFSRRGDDLYRTHWARGALVVEEWVDCVWRGVSDVDYVLSKTIPISSRAAAEMIEQRCGPGAAAPE